MLKLCFIRKDNLILEIKFKLDHNSDYNLWFNLNVVVIHAEVEIPVASNLRPLVGKTLVASNLE